MFKKIWDPKMKKVFRNFYELKPDPTAIWSASNRSFLYLGLFNYWDSGLESRLMWQKEFSLVLSVSVFKWESLVLKRFSPILCLWF